MTWRLPNHPHETFRRNSLIAVIYQLRFDPILKIRDGVPEFQDRIRGRFPTYEEREVRHVEVDVRTGVHLRTTMEHRFENRGTPSTVVLGDQGVAIEYPTHQHRDVLLEDVNLVMDALTEAYQAVSPTRLGLRYVNEINKTQVSKDLNREVSWSDLLSPGFLAIPEGLATLQGTRFASELSSPMPMGEMTVRYGLLNAPSEVFRLDIDRYRDGTFNVQDAKATVEGFSLDIFRVFRTSLADSLVEWMNDVS